MIPPSWHGWMHHTVDLPPTEENYKPRPWQKPHRPNLTGTPAAHRPTGSTLGAGPPPEGDRRLQGLDSWPLTRPLDAWSLKTAFGLLAAKPNSPGRESGLIPRRYRPFPAVFPVLTGHLIPRRASTALVLPFG